MRLREFMHYPIVTCSPATTVQSAARLMERHNVGSLVITDEHLHPLGIITDRDIALAVAHDLSASASIQSLMTANVVTISADADIHDAAGAMDSRAVRRLPVVDGEGRVIGMICLDDLLAYLREETIILTGALQAQTPTM